MILISAVKIVINFVSGRSFCNISDAIRVNVSCSELWGSGVTFPIKDYKTEFFDKSKSGYSSIKAKMKKSMKKEYFFVTGKAILLAL